MIENLLHKSEIPMWDLASIYKSFDSPEYIAAKSALSSAVEELISAAGNNALYTDSYKEWLETAIKAWEKAGSIYENLYAYCYTAYSVETSNSRALKELFQLEQTRLKLSKAKKTVTEKIRPEIEIPGENKTDNRFLSNYSLFIEEAFEHKKHLLPGEIEDVIEELLQPGADSWSRLQEAVSSSLTACWNKKSGEKKTVTELRSLAFHEDRKIRKKAYRKEIKAWRKVEIPLAFALNGVKGSGIIIDRRKKWDSAVSKSIFQSRISEKTIQALLSAMEKSLPDFQRYLKAKAVFLGLEKLAFYDLFAPVKVKTSEKSLWTFNQAKDFIIETFRGFSDDMGSFAEKAFNNNWIDAMPRKGKVGGAYCITFPVSGQNRILCSFNSSFSSVSTIAHELGHAYHSEILKTESFINRNYPMTLAETASIFSEILLFDTAIEKAGGDEKIFLTEMLLQEVTQVIVDILSRFYFEKSVFKKRKDGDLTAQEFSILMKEAQKKTYGKAVEKESYHQYMWAVKGHYYIPDLSFYNYPYAFGQLFAIALYRQYLSDKKGFPGKYSDILRMTGKYNAADTAAFAGFDIEDESFWLDNLSYVKKMIIRFEEEADKCRQRLE